MAYHSPVFGIGSGIGPIPNTQHLTPNTLHSIYQSIRKTIIKDVVVSAGAVPAAAPELALEPGDAGVEMVRQPEGIVAVEIVLHAAARPRFLQSCPLERVV